MISDYEKKMLLSSFSSILSRIVFFSQVLLVYPILIEQLGPIEFGILMALLGFGIILNVLDFGIGNAIVRIVSQANESHDRIQISSSICSGILLLSCLSALICIVLAIATINFDLSWLFKDLDREATASFKDTFLLFIALFGLNLFNNFSLKVFQGLQLSFIYNASIVVMQVCTIFYVFQLTHQLTINTSLIALYGAPAFGGALVLFFLPIAAKLKLSLGNINLKYYSKEILNKSKLFIFLQFAYVLGMSLDIFWVATILGTDAVGELSLLQRYFQLLTLPIALLVGPLWAAYSKFQINYDFVKIGRYLRVSMISAFVVASLGGFILINLFPLYVTLFKTDINFLLNSVIRLAALMALIETMAHVFAMYLNGMHIVRPQIICTCLLTVVMLPTKYYFTLNYGLEGLYTASIVVYVLCVAIPYMTFLRHQVSVKSQFLPQAWDQK